MNFFPFDPVAGHASTPAPPDTTHHRAVRFREIIRADTNAFRWKFFGSFPVRDGQRQPRSGFFMIDTGRSRCAKRRRCQAATAVATGDAAAREQAWKRLESAVSGRADTADLSGKEPSARRRG
jgi:hypothetical protein